MSRNSRKGLIRCGFFRKLASDDEFAGQNIFPPLLSLLRLSLFGMYILFKYFFSVGPDKMLLRFPSAPQVVDAYPLHIVQMTVFVDLSALICGQ
jgi:hypothetical protein